MESRTFVQDILLCDENQRLERLVQIFYKQRVEGKRYESKAWHGLFRHFAKDPVTFYQNSATLFVEDTRHDDQLIQSISPTFIHGNLHLGQFEYFDDDVTQERRFQIRTDATVIGFFTDDLRRLAANIALIAYCQGFNTNEMLEILHVFIRKYIQFTFSIKQSSMAEDFQQDDQFHSNRTFQYKRSSSVVGLVPVKRKMHKIDWHSIDNVKDFMILVEQLAAATSDFHCQLRVIFNNIDETLLAPIDHSRQHIQSVLSCTDAQKQLINELSLFAVTYAEIAERDHRIFFKSFRNAQHFNMINLVKNQRIERPWSLVQKLQILIVGGGIGGMATALCFARAGIRVQLFEKNNNFIELGAGMQLAPNCSRILDQLGVLEKVHSKAVFPKEIVWMDALTGEYLTSIDLGKEFLQAFHYPYIVVHRADLLNTLYEACKQTGLVIMETNRMVIGVDERPKSVMIECADGFRYDCDMVIAADGLWSSLRKFVYDDGPPLTVGYVTYRGTVPIDRVSKEAGLENVQFWIGPDMHLVQYPIRSGELFNQAAVFKSKKTPDETDQWGTKDELNERFSIGCDHVKRALTLLQTNFRWPVFELVLQSKVSMILEEEKNHSLSNDSFLFSRNPLSKWSRHRLVLLGDGAHPMLQYAAQGAAQALEDAYVLCNSYQRHGPSRIQAIFQEYERKRIPRTSKVVQFARDIGIFAHHDGKEKMLRDNILRLHNPTDFQFLKRLYAENVE